MVKLPLFLASLLVLTPAVPLAWGAPSGTAEFKGCYARWSTDQLTVGNDAFERSWVVTASGLEASALKTKLPETVWMTTPAKRTGANGAPLDVTASSGRTHTVEADSLRLSVNLSGPAATRLTIQLFPGLAGCVVTQESPEIVPEATVAATVTASGIEVAPKRAETAWPLGVMGVRPAPEHLRVVQVELADQTDEHDELVFEREWLLSAKEKPFATVGNLLVVEDALSGAGLVYVSLSPLPHARPVKRPRDFDIDPRRRAIRPVPDNHPTVLLAYSGGRDGRIAVLQRLQRSLRTYDPARDGRFMSNTWGDRSRDARINEAFMREEITAGARLGVDVIQIDDGWQKGRSSNSARGTGVWNGYWAADPAFWTPDPARFPHGLAPVVAAARERGMKFGLWYAPDSSHDAANWNRDADRILELHREGIDYVKVDSIKTPTAAAAANQRRFFDRVLEQSRGDVVFDLDVTAETRPGYFGVPQTGPVFVENRYTDFRSYWPHHTLRNLWRLAHYVDPLRLRIEFLNPERNAAKYGDDPLAPARYRPDTLFAITMVANPLGWFETSHLSESFVTSVAPLVAAWKAERGRLHGGTIVPVGDAPDGRAWTGFTSRAADGSGYILLFRELNPSATYALRLDGLGGAAPRVSMLGGRGTAKIANEQLQVTIPEPLDFVWVWVDAAP